MQIRPIRLQSAHVLTISWLLPVYRDQTFDCADVHVCPLCKCFFFAFLSSTVHSGKTSGEHHVWVWDIPLIVFLFFFFCYCHCHVGYQMLVVVLFSKNKICVNLYFQEEKLFNNKRKSSGWCLVWFCHFHFTHWHWKLQFSNKWF